MATANGTPSRNAASVDERAAGRSREPAGCAGVMLNTLGVDGTYTNHRPTGTAEHSDFAVGAQSKTPRGYPAAYAARLAESCTLPGLSMSHQARTRLLQLFKERAFSFGDFTLASGKKSTYYINSK